ncbi:KR-domain-containing protein [Lindgomyces ingoldianus]|uniref:KR-domain-containing protein n=1 Tax=Lindgomyces ingoldianus TaxID=673940 RepID=A0ACB6QC99_9PLEO|nr:KR-domain-containing protein [Lindgomyces ingoldianus]KAF2463776.1 KR-domain-containing protein [Lindgomyces ingoldianus]
MSGIRGGYPKPGAMMSVNLQEGNSRAYADNVPPSSDIHYLSCLDLLGDPVLDNNATLMVSSVTGQKVTPTELSTGQYWVDNLTSPVCFVDALQYIMQAAPKLDGIKAISDYIEIGPHGALHFKQERVQISFSPVKTRFTSENDNVGMSAVANKASTGDGQKRLLHRIDWKPQLSLVTTHQLSDYCDVEKFTDDEAFAIDYCVRLEDTLRTRLERNLTQLQEAVGPKTPEHLRRFVSRIERQLCIRPGQYVDEIRDERLREELENLRAIRPSWRIFIDVVQNLASIVRKETDALDLLFSTPLAQDLYDEFSSAHAITSCFRILSWQPIKLPTNEFSRSARRTGGTAFCEYVYTNVSPAYFPEARELFADYRNRMNFKTLDLEQDISASIEPRTCDIILAGSVLHATKNLSSTPRNLRRALKPGGRLIFLEITAPECFESRAWCPTITKSDWDVLLRDNGFSGNELVIRDYEDDRSHYVSIIASSADRPSHTIAEGSRVLIVINDENQRRLASDLVRGVFDSSGYHPMVVTLSQIGDAEVCPTDIVIFLANIGGLVLAEPSDDTFKMVQDWAQQSKQLLRVTASIVSQQSYPYTSLKDGFLRVIRSENDSKRIISLSLEDGTSDPGFLQHIAQVFHSAFEITSPNFEYIVRNGRILTGCLVLEPDLNKDLNSSIHPQMKNEAWFLGPPVKLNVGTHEHRTTLGLTDIKIEIQAWAIGFRDVFSALGRLDENEFGTDCAGVVKRVGSQCTELRPGGRVCTSSFGCMRTYVLCHELDAFKISDALSVEEACGVINPIMTAWYSLVDVARLKRREKIFIHAASGATGQVAIQVVQMVGAEIFATVGYHHKKQLLMDEYGIPASHIFYSRDLSFAQGIMRVTEGLGEGLRTSWECVAPYGRFIEIGKADINANTPLPMASFANNVSLSAADLRHLDFNRRGLFEMGPSIVQGHCIPTPGKSTGRVVIQVDHSAKVQKHIIHRRTWGFDGNATYVVAAGLGGVGRSILRWMASKGAKQLIVPSTSGAASKEAIQVVSDVTKLGVKIVTPKCDVSVASCVQRMLDDYAQVMSPIHGCINATMVLQDSVFDNMTRAQWETTIRSKAQSSWILHTLLPKDLDFFILLSSASGIVGNAGQSNYAAGCTFQDSLSRFCVCHGQKAVSIDLGPMRSKSFEKYPGLAPIEEEEFLTLLDILCDPDYHSRNSTVKSQVTMGIVTPDDLVLEGGDLPLEHLHQSLFACFNQAGAASSNSVSANSVNSAALFQQAESVEEMTSIVVESLVRKLARVLSIQAEDVDVDRPLHLYGVDSLVAVELRNWITKDFAVDVPVFELMSGKTF